MKSPLLLTLSLAPLACAGAEPTQVAPQAPVALSGPPVVVNLDPPPVAPKPAAPAADDKQEKGAPFGIIGLINSGAGSDPNAPTAPWGRDDTLSNAKGNMWGDTDSDSFGAGGLGLSGIGVGGGGLGGTGVGFGAGHGTKGPSLRQGAVSVAGRLPPEVIQRIVRQNFGRFRLCYETGLRAKPTLEGKIGVKFVIEPDGSVSGVGTAETTMPDPAVVACVTRAFSNLSFPAPEGGKVSVVYPLVFRPGEAAAPPAAATPTPPSP